MNIREDMMEKKERKKERGRKIGRIEKFFKLPKFYLHAKDCADSFGVSHVSR